MTRNRQLVTTLGVIAAAILFWMENPWFNPEDIQVGGLDLRAIATVVFWVLFLAVVVLMFQERNEQIRQQAAILQAERDRLAALLAQAGLVLPAAEGRSPDGAGHPAELEHLRQQAAREQVFATLAKKAR